jgi:hypothetical protein
MTEQIVRLIGYDGDRELDFGGVVFDGEEFTTMVGPDGTDELLDSVMAEPVFVQRTNKLVDVYADDDPWGFFDGLAGMYRSYALTAMPPRDLTDEDLADYEMKEVSEDE